MKKKTRAMFIVGVVLSLVGIVGLFGLFSQENQNNIVGLLIGSLALIAIGICSIIYDHNKANPQKTTEKKAVIPPSAARQFPPTNKYPTNNKNTQINNSTSNRESPKSAAPKIQTPNTYLAENKNTQTINNNENRTLYKDNCKKAFNHILNNIEKHQINYSPDNLPENINIKDFYMDFNKLRKDTNINRLLNFVVIDVETTGLTPGQHKITQLSAIRFIDFSPVEIFSTYVNPGVSIPEKITEITGITDEIVAKAPRLETVLPDFETFVGKSTIVGFNLIFDLKFLRKFGYDSLMHKRFYFDILEISRSIDNDSYDHKLSTVCNDNNIFFDAHSSDADALAAGLLFITYICDKLDLKSSEYPNTLLYYYTLKNFKT